MDPFEVIIVHVSIVLTLGLGKLLTGIFELIGPDDSTGCTYFGASRATVSVHSPRVRLSTIPRRQCPNFEPHFQPLSL